MKKLILFFICMLLLCCSSCNSTPNNGSNNSNNPGQCSHEWTEASCTAPRTCTVCKQTEGDPIAHSWVDATCEMAKHCSVCMKSEGYANDHTWDGKGTCTEPATCLVCHKTNGRAHDHAWEEADCEVPKTCSQCGVTEGDALGHFWEGGSCTEPPECSYCYKTDTKPLGHRWESASCLSPAYCSECGQENGEPLGHDWVEATCTEPKHCQRCRKQNGNALRHDYVDYYCTRCSDFVADTISELKTYLHLNYEILDTAIGKTSSMNISVTPYYSSDPWRTCDYEIIFHILVYIDDVKSSLDYALMYANFLPYEDRVQAVIDVLKAQMELAELLTIAFPDKKFEIKFFVEGYEYPALELGYSSETIFLWKNYKPNNSGINGYDSTDICEWYIDAEDFLKGNDIDTVEPIIDDILAAWKPYKYPLHFWLK